MKFQESEQERIKRIRDEQLRARDPKAKERRQSARYAQKSKKLRENQKLAKDTISSIPHIWRVGFYGLAIGFIIKICLPLFFTANWVSAAGWAIMLVTTAFGVLFGASLDWRDDLRDF